MDQIRHGWESSGEVSLGQGGFPGSTSATGPLPPTVPRAAAGGRPRRSTPSSGRSRTAPACRQPASTAACSPPTSQCHGTGGVGGFDRIRGSDAAEVRTTSCKPARSDIMAAHAQGCTSAQPRRDHRLPKQSGTDPPCPSCQALRRRLLLGWRRPGTGMLGGLGRLALADPDDDDSDDHYEESANTSFAPANTGPERPHRGGRRRHGRRDGRQVPAPVGGTGQVTSSSRLPATPPTS